MEADLPKETCEHLFLSFMKKPPSLYKQHGKVTVQGHFREVDGNFFQRACCANMKTLMYLGLCFINKFGGHSFQIKNHCTNHNTKYY